MDARTQFAEPKQVLRYLSRYTRRVAISIRRLLAADEKGVTIRYKDYRMRWAKSLQDDDARDR